MRSREEGNACMAGFSGCHRYEAHQKLGLPTIKCKIRRGTRETLRCLNISSFLLCQCRVSSFFVWFRFPALWASCLPTSVVTDTTRCAWSLTNPPFWCWQAPPSINFDRSSTPNTGTFHFPLLPSRSVVEIDSKDWIDSKDRIHVENKEGSRLRSFLIARQLVKC